MDLDDIPVADVMTQGVVSCASDMPLSDIATRMEASRIHCVVVQPSGSREEGRAWGVVSDLDLVGAISMPEISAGAIAATPTVTVSTQDSVGRAASLMSEYQTTHLLVLDAGGYPSGVVSTLDVARALSRSPTDVG